MAGGIADFLTLAAVAFLAALLIVAFVCFAIECVREAQNKRDRRAEQAYLDRLTRAAEAPCPWPLADEVDALRRKAAL